MSDADEWLTIAEAAEQLAVKRQTLYSYISRGRLRSRRLPDGRTSQVYAADVAHLRSLSEWRRTATIMPTPSSLTVVRDGAMSYRGRDVIGLAASNRFEHVAELLWDQTDQPKPAWFAPESDVRACRRAAETVSMSMLDRLRIAASCATVLRPWGPELSIGGYGAWLLPLLVSSLPQRSEPDGPACFARLIASRLAPHTVPAELVDIVDDALILLADHDLPESTRVVRLAAGAGVHPAGVVALGLDIRGGPVKSAALIGLHGLLDDAATTRVDAYRPRAGEPVPGFGHAAYPDGDPRAAYLLHRIREFDPVFIKPIDDALRTNLSSLPPPNIGFALTAIVELLGAEPEASELIFVMARSAGWLAHTREEYAHETVRGTYHTVYQGP